ncbi:ATP-dependent nuclease [Streptomyces europaeiscabiei]|uniref:ATP-dependent nuclease n=1 Tax=Streptomyces europaeiscabiei TaxID=146819 RepID=UPI00099C9E49|nr:ATP-binding protein [Streptomyces europaeiscabiei]
MLITNMTVSDWKGFDTASLALSRINVLVGRNNSGKSALIRAAQFLQSGTTAPESEIRLGAEMATVQYNLADFDVRKYAPELATVVAAKGLAEDGLIPQVRAETRLKRPSRNQNIPWAQISHVLQTSDNAHGDLPKISPTEPENFIYPYLSKRKVGNYDRQVDKGKADQVTGNLQLLSAKVARLTGPGYPGSEQFSDLCKRLLGMSLGTVMVENGQLVGFTVGRLGSITIESMGEGISSLLGLITDLCVAEGQLFLIEEPENDIHPDGLKALLDVIIEKSANNQFIVSTHSNLVVKYLASAPDSRLFQVEQRPDARGVPTSTVKLIESAEDRAAVLRDLGYDLHDFDLAEGWLILEESSAERIILDYLIPWFAPKLTRIRTVAAGGTGGVEPTFREFGKLVLFVHREEVFKHRAWVIVDGDQSGQDVVSKLKAKYATWPNDRFKCFSKPRFEDYYPSRFKEQIEDAFSKPKGRQQQEAKSALRQEVQDWCDANRELAKKELTQSAAEVITVLQEIEKSLFQR